jgi:hypothetical protein
MFQDWLSSDAADAARAATAEGDRIEEGAANADRVRRGGLPVRVWCAAGLKVVLLRAAIQWCRGDVFSE